jgi:hypothetical protein
VHGCHALPSPHPTLPLQKYFFFPGFTAQTGGLLREHGLVETLAELSGSAQLQQQFWQGLGLLDAMQCTFTSIDQYPVFILAVTDR